MTPLARKLLILFAVLGLGASSAATYVHYNLIRNPDYSSFCDINATVSCRAAYLSRYGSIGGVPVALLGLAFFVSVRTRAPRSARARHDTHGPPRRGGLRRRVGLGDRQLSARAPASRCRRG